MIVNADHPSLDILVLSLLLAVLVLAVLTCFFKPAYEPGFYMVLGALTSAFSAACGAKWGLTQSGPAPNRAPGEDVVLKEPAA